MNAAGRGYPTPGSQSAKRSDQAFAAPLKTQGRGYSLDPSGANTCMMSTESMSATTEERYMASVRHQARGYNPMPDEA